MKKEKLKGYAGLLFGLAMCILIFLTEKQIVYHTLDGPSKGAFKLTLDINRTRCFIFLHDLLRPMAVTSNEADFYAGCVYLSLVPFFIFLSWNVRARLGKLLCGLVKMLCDLVKKIHQKV